MNSAHQHFQFAQKFAKVMDNQFKVFGFSVGLDPILGLIPGLGDFLPLFFSFYIIWIAFQLEIPKHKIAQMGVNVFLDTVIGMIPFAGDIFDFFFQSHTYNLKIIENHLADQPIIITSD